MTNIEYFEAVRILAFHMGTKNVLVDRVIQLTKVGTPEVLQTAIDSLNKDIEILDGQITAIQTAIKNHVII
jgi:hypothetical protein